MNSAADAMRVSDAEREPFVERLKTAFADGQLDRDEFEARVQRAMTARTRADLFPLTVDLDRPPAYFAPPASTYLAPPLPTQGPSGEERLMAGVAHATGLVPVLVLPLLILLTKGRESAYIRHHAAQAFNLQLTVLLVTMVTFGIGAIAYTVLWAVALAGAAIAVAGSDFRYPFTLQLLGRRSTPGW